MNRCFLSKGGLCEPQQQQKLCLDDVHGALCLFATLHQHLWDGERLKRGAGGRLREGASTGQKVSV